MIGLFDWLKLGTGAVVGAMLCYPVANYLGERQGRQEAAQAALKTSIDILRERKLTDDQIQGMSDADLCVALGGVFTDGRCE